MNGRNSCSWWIALAAVAGLLVGCGATKKEETAAGKVTVSGTITCAGCTSGSLVIGAITKADADSNSGSPFLTATVTGGTAVTFSLSIDASKGEIYVYAFQDTNANGDADSTEWGGYVATTVGASSVSGVNFTLTLGGLSTGGGGGGGTVTVSGTITFAGWTSGGLILGAITKADADANGSPFTQSSIAGGTSVAYSLSIDANKGDIYVFAFQDTNSNGNPDSSEYGGYTMITVGSSSVSGVDITVTLGGISGVGGGGTPTGDTATIVVNSISSTYDEATSSNFVGYEPLILAAYYPTSTFDAVNGCADFVINVISGIGGTAQAPTIAKMLNLTPCMATATTGTFNGAFINAEWTDMANSVSLQIKGNDTTTGTASVTIDAMGAVGGTVSGSFNLSFANPTLQGGLPDPLVITGTFSMTREQDEFSAGGGGGGGATLLTVDAPVTSSFININTGALYYFQAASETAYTVTLTPSSGDVDLDVCATSTCPWGGGPVVTGPTGGQSHTAGTAAETVTFTPASNGPIYVNVWAVASSDYTIRVTSGGGGGGGGTLTYSNSNGVAELTDVPTLPATVPTTLSSTFNVDVPVDSDTAEVVVFFGYDFAVGNMVGVGYGAASLTSGTPQTATVPVTIFDAVPAGTYYATVFVCASAGTCDYSVAGTVYFNSTTAPGTYMKYQYDAGGMTGTFTETAVTMPTVTVP